jgi:hypothetical protein
MNKSSTGIFISSVLSILVTSIILTSCKKTENPIKFPEGIFPDSTMNLSDINSSFDDINTTLYGNSLFIFSTNRESSGGQFDLVQGAMSFVFDQCSGEFGLGVEISNNPFLTKLINSATTTGDDFGPYQLFSTVDGFEYLLLSSENSSGNLDFYFLKHQPVFGNNLPDISGPYSVKLLNTSADDAYICFDSNVDTTYFSSNSEGNFEIFFKSKPSESALDIWFNEDYSASAKVDSINSTSEDKCPFIHKKVMVFTSDRPGGMGGFDLYYSIFRHGKWSSPVNFGPDINTSSDEYRPIIGTHPDFTNNLMIFSSNRPGGKGGYDLYFRGVTFPE